MKTTIKLTDGSVFCCENAQLFYVPSAENPHTVDVQLLKLGRMFSIPYAIIEHINCEEN